jgi:hypothetical protein
MSIFAIRVVDATGFRDQRGARYGKPLTDPMFQWQLEVVPYAPEGFNWECPTCGHAWWGQIGAQPVSGWNDPRWVNSGTRERPTLTPSLGCRGLHDGTCAGHWWLRDGVLVGA